jgi:hypothetical protein
MRGGGAGAERKHGGNGKEGRRTDHFVARFKITSM